MLGDYFTTMLVYEFDGIITDIPWEAVKENKAFDYKGFMTKASADTIDDSFLITFCSMLALHDLIANCGEWRFKTYQIWNKRNTNFVNFHYPLRQVEFIAYFIKGTYQFDFRNGQQSMCPKRKQVGLRANDPAGRPEFSQGTYTEIVEYLNPRNKINKYEKPIEFSRMFRHIVGDKHVLDPFCGTGNLLKCFKSSTGMDIKKY